MKEEVKEIRKAENASKLPEKLKDSWLLGIHEDILFLASTMDKSELSDDMFVYGYSLGNRITSCMTIKDSAWPESWTQQGNTLYVGTRNGKIVAIDMKAGRIIGQQKFNNSIDAIAANNQVFAGVNGRGVVKLKRDLKSEAKFYIASEEIVHAGDTEKYQHLPVTSAITIFNDNIFLFHFSNGKDPCLGDTGCGGLVEVLKRDLKSQTERKLIPYAVKHAVADEEGIYFATSDESNGWIPEGQGDLYSLNPQNLAYHHVRGEFAAVTSMARYKGKTLLGLKNGVLASVGDSEKTVCLHNQQTAIKGIVIKNDKIYVSAPGKIIELG